MNPSPILERTVDLLNTDGSRVRFTAAFGPVHAAGEDCRCPVRVSGWGNSPPDIWGHDSVQALLLAVHHVHSLLRTFLEHGGRVVHAGTDDDFHLESILSDAEKSS